MSVLSRRCRTDVLLASIDEVLWETDDTTIDVALQEAVSPQVDGYIAMCGSLQAALDSQNLLVDNDGNPRVENVFGLGHDCSCGCTLCLDVSEVPVDEGDPWLAAAPALPPAAADPGSVLGFGDAVYDMFAEA